MVSWSLTAAERQTYGRYAGLALPRHTSYPIVPAWKAEHGPARFRADLQRSAENNRPLSLYVHVPFCEHLCYYCACTKEIIPPAKHRDQDPGGNFLDSLEAEVQRFAEVVGGNEVHQVHLGGGSPTFLHAPQLERLGHILRQGLAITAEAEMAIELDPRITTLDQLQTLRRLGFNRISLGIQDFDEKVQRTVNRLQSFECVQQTMDWCRQLGFSSINFDLIYGLPFQTVATMAGTLDKAIRLGPDRVAFYRLAVIPEIFRWQNVFRPEDLPGGDLPLELNLLAINRFQEAGYEFIGLDHFARADEALAAARRQGSLQRNFQGMTTGKNLDLLGLGPSAITQLEDAFAQNVKSSGEWRLAVARDFATERGLHLSPDDRLRRELLQQLYGHGTVAKPDLEKQFGIAFDSYFADELSRLTRLVDDGLVQLEPTGIRLTAPLGRLLVRVVAAVFDRYLPPQAYYEGLPSHLSSKVG